MPANIAYLFTFLKGFMIYSRVAWYDSPVMKNIEKFNKHHDVEPDMKPASDLKRTLLEVRLRDALEKHKRPEKGAE